mmetsp:Transcript_35562/g.114328  ORF Transcript_35562/g.114328 Transcript_35562/m.114328 type:complete len:222 (-) Transcript_35562:66-731(-)
MREDEPLGLAALREVARRRGRVAAQRAKGGVLGDEIVQPLRAVVVRARLVLAAARRRANLRHACCEFEKRTRLPDLPAAPLLHREKRVVRRFPHAAVDLRDAFVDDAVVVDHLAAGVEADRPHAARVARLRVARVDPPAVGRVLEDSRAVGARVEVEHRRRAVGEQHLLLRLGDEPRLQPHRQLDAVRRVGLHELAGLVRHVGRGRRRGGPERPWRQPGRG